MTVREPWLDARERLTVWLDGVQLSARLGFPTYRNPGELKDDLRLLLARLDEATSSQAGPGG